ncbi:alanine racemase [Campylobacter iguaniorum]|uniref:alanine racemase n=1 Tax=Campylobacter iguaniorum TaxID=1244531 RepID=UPI00073A2532|nr:alanine racemase [Campylobacter iguaniorum]ALV25286.1 alanine racemase [Campylobacter iguaniorum]
MSEILINRAAYLHNLTQISNKVGSKDRIIVILKDNAYGHGALQIAKLASEFGIKFACVRTMNEAQEIAEFFKNILILSHIPTGDEDLRFIYTINDISNLSVLKSGCKVHLGIDTLMHRNGLGEDELESAFEIASQRNIEICGAFTHFRSSDETSAEYFVQRENFAKAKAKIKALGAKFGLNLTFHSNNSAGIERATDFDDEFVRAGIAQHGYEQFNSSLSLKPVMSLWADLVSKRFLKAGQSVGYGAKFTAKEDIQIATYDLGYGDGLLRYAGIGELKLANGNLLLGKMSMDSFSTKYAGDRVCVFDDARVWAEFFGTISYDVLVKLSPIIKRTIV